ncbi:MAG: MaoC family dehydratase N-terminal domain-containing protein [Roseobacter sp.]
MNALDNTVLHNSSSEVKTADAKNAPLTDWVGRTQTVTGCLSPDVAATVHATLAPSDTACPQDGEPMPALWHWYAFPPIVGTEALGFDGHPKLGGFMPPVPFERRMWASGRLTFFNDLRIGEPIRKTSTIVSVDEKSGSTGGMVFVELDIELSGADGLAVRETQTIVYLPIAPEFTPPPKKPAPGEDMVFNKLHPVSTVLLFRYSAITFNAHRIHYDLPYAQEIEHYPGLVVHGPLQANLLMAEATRWKDRRPDRFSFRGVHPMFHDCDMHLRATAGAEGALNMCTVAPGGHMCMTAKAVWED